MATNSEIEFTGMKSKERSVAQRHHDKIVGRLRGQGRLVTSVKLGEGQNETFLIYHMPDPAVTGGSLEKLVVVDGKSSANRC